MNDIQQLRFWSYKILPLVYDDSLSYYEVLAKITAKTNELVKNANTIPEYIKSEVADQLSGTYATDIANSVKEQVDALTTESQQTVENLSKAVYTGILKAIATNEGEATYTATAKEAGEVIWLNNVLYEVTAPMAVGTNYVVGSNISPLVISDELNHMKGYLSDMNEFYHERSAKAYDTGVYLYYKDNLYITTKDIAVNDILYTDGENQNLKEVTVGDEITKHYTEMHEADNNLQNQIDGNDGDIEKLQSSINGLLTDGNDFYAPKQTQTLFATIIKPNSSYYIQGSDCVNNILYVGYDVGSNNGRVYKYSNFGTGDYTPTGYVTLTGCKHVGSITHYDGKLYVGGSGSGTTGITRRTIWIIDIDTFTVTGTLVLPFLGITDPSVTASYDGYVMISGHYWAGNDIICFICPYNSETKEIDVSNYIWYAKPCINNRTVRQASCVYQPTLLQLTVVSGNQGGTPHTFIEQTSLHSAAVPVISKTLPWIGEAESIWQRDEYFYVLYSSGAIYQVGAISEFLTWSYQQDTPTAQPSPQLHPIYRKLLTAEDLSNSARSNLYIASIPVPTIFQTARNIGRLIAYTITNSVTTTDIKPFTFNGFYRFLTGNQHNSYYIVSNNIEYLYTMTTNIINNNITLTFNHKEKATDSDTWTEITDNYFENLTIELMIL